MLSQVHEAFSRIWGTARLWTSHDGTNLNLPVGDSDQPSTQLGDLHWDCDMRLWSLQEAKANRPIVGGVQGVLYLVDTPAANGAFVCVPGFHRVRRPAIRYDSFKLSRSIDSLR